MLRFLFILMFLVNSAEASSNLLNPQTKFCIVTPSYNNAKFYQENIESVLQQTYQNWQMIIIDDHSTDYTGELIKNYIEQQNLSSKITLIQNKENKGALANIYNTIHNYCQDEMVVVILDGDDLLYTSQALQTMADTYANPEIWLAYSQYKRYVKRGWWWVKDFKPSKLSKALPLDVIKQNSFRDTAWSTSHLRTFYAWLFKRIKKDDLIYQGIFFPTTSDLAIMYPMLEMASQGHIKFVPEVLYLYRRLPTNDVEIHKKEQLFFADYIQALPKYTPLKSSNHSIR